MRNPAKRAHPHFQFLCLVFVSPLTSFTSFRHKWGLCLILGLGTSAGTQYLCTVTHSCGNLDWVSSGCKTQSQAPNLYSGDNTPAGIQHMGSEREDEDLCRHHSDWWWRHYKQEVTPPGNGSAERIRHHLRRPSWESYISILEMFHDTHVYLVRVRGRLQSHFPLVTLNPFRIRRLVGLKMFLGRE